MRQRYFFFLLRTSPQNLETREEAILPDVRYYQLQTRPHGKRIIQHPTRCLWQCTSVPHQPWTTALWPSTHLYPHNFPQLLPSIQEAFYDYPFGLDNGTVRASSPQPYRVLCRFKTLGTNSTTWLLLQFPLHHCNTHSHHKQVSLAAIH